MVYVNLHVFFKYNILKTIVENVNNAPHSTLTLFKVDQFYDADSVVDSLVVSAHIAPV